MKRVLLVALCILILCSPLLANVATVKDAEASGYTRIDWPTQVIPSIDGTWSPSTEWDDTDRTVIGDDAAFGSTWDSTAEGVFTRWLMPVFSMYSLFRNVKLASYLNLCHRGGGILTENALSCFSIM